MSSTEYRFNIAAVLLAVVLAAVGISDVHAGGSRGGTVSSGENRGAAGPAATGGKGGVNGGDVRSRGGAGATARHGQSARHGAAKSQRARAVAPQAISAWPPPPAEAGAAWPSPPRDTITPTGGLSGGVVGSRK